jgi:hypothetical protein
MLVGFFDLSYKMFDGKMTNGITVFGHGPKIILNNSRKAVRKQKWLLLPMRSIVCTGEL